MKFLSYDSKVNINNAVCLATKLRLSTRLQFSPVTSCRPGFSKTTWRVSQLKPCKALMPFLSSAWLCGLTVTSWCKAFFGGPIGSHLAVRSAGNGFFRTGIFGKAKSGHKLRRRMYSVTGTQGWVLIECNHI